MPHAPAPDLAAQLKVLAGNLKTAQDVAPPLTMTAAQQALFDQSLVTHGLFFDKPWSVCRRVAHEGKPFVVVYGRNKLPAYYLLPESLYTPPEDTILLPQPDDLKTRALFVASLPPTLLSAYASDQLFAMQKHMRDIAHEIEVANRGHKREQRKKLELKHFILGPKRVLLAPTKDVAGKRVYIIRADCLKKLTRKKKSAALRPVLKQIAAQPERT